MDTDEKSLLSLQLGIIVALLISTGASLLSLKNHFDQRNVIEEAFLHGPKQIEEARTAVKEARTAVEEAKKIHESDLRQMQEIEKRIKALEAEQALRSQDADHDGVLVPADKCPNSAPAEGEARYVIPTNGCLENEVVHVGECDKPVYPPDKDTGGKGKLWFKNCSLRERPEYVYQCSFELNAEKTAYQSLNDCHGIDPNVTGG